MSLKLEVWGGIMWWLLAISVVSAKPSGQLGARIVNGTDATRGQFPYQVSVRHNREHHCGGSIVSSLYILTAAHCLGEDLGGGFEPFPVRKMTVRVGSSDRLAGGEIRRIARLIIHEGYKGLLNDVGLMRLSKPLIFSELVQPIELQREALETGRIVTTSGWGRLSTFGDLPRRLQWLQLPLLEEQQCLQVYNFKQPSLVCLEHPRGQGACFADSGGPSVFGDKLVGIFNFVLSGCATDKPDAAAKVSFYYDWILNKTDLH